MGEAEKRIRELFSDAEAEQKSAGAASDLHIIIFDEIDAICKTRGSTRDGTGVGDSIVSSYLRMDGIFLCHWCCLCFIYALSLSLYQ